MRTDELLNRLEHGDAEALDELIRMYYPEILRYCLWHTSDRPVSYTHLTLPTTPYV